MSNQDSQIKTQGKTPLFTANYPTLFEPRAWKDPATGAEGQPKYSVMALFEKGQDLSPLKKLAEAAMIKKFGPDKKKWPQVPDFLMDQAEKAKETDGKRVLPPGFVEGAKYMYLDSKNKPVIVDQSKRDITDQNKIYSGCKGYAVVNAKYWERKDRYGSKCGIKFYLNGFQLHSDGPPIGGFTKAEDLFEAIDDTGDASNSSVEDMFN